jgi:Fibronectin type III domain
MTRHVRLRSHHGQALHRGTWSRAALPSQLGAVAVVAVACVELAVAPLAWSAPESALGGGTTFQPKTTLTDVSCWSATDCTAVGYYGTEATGPFEEPSIEPIYAIETSGVWGKPIEIAAPSGDGGFSGISCSSAEDCTVVGYEYTGQYSAPHGFANLGYPVYATETDGTWSRAAEITSSSGGSGFNFGASDTGFDAVSCTSAGNCTAVGGLGPFYATESDGVWGPATFVDTPGAAGEFFGISCVSAGECTVVGSDDTFDGDYGIFSVNEPIYATETGGVWGAAAEVVAPYGTSFNAVSCYSATDCTAVGSDGSPFYATETDGTWPPVTVLGFPGTFYGISCPSATECTAAGAAGNPAFGSVADGSMHVTDTDGTWGSPSVAGGGTFSNISCSSVTACTAVGSFDECATANACADPGSYATYSTERAGVWLTAPTPPRISKAEALDRGISVSWTRSGSQGGSAVVGYTATATLTLKGLVHVYLCSTTRLTCTIAHLTNDRTYTVTVFARNAVGSSKIAPRRAVRPRA